MNRNIDPFMRALLLLITFSLIVAFLAPRNYHKHGYAKIAKMKSRLKQIGTIVAMYYSDADTNLYPQNPALFEIDESFLYSDDIKTWEDISLNTPYFFFPNTGDEYTGEADKPLAINWEHFDIPPYYQVVWEDGHVSTVSPEEAKKMMKSSEKNRRVLRLYQELNKKNEPFQ